MQNSSDCETVKVFAIGESVRQMITFKFWYYPLLAFVIESIFPQWHAV